MRLLIEKISQLQIGWNERQFGESDVDNICRCYGITLDERPLTTSGFYYRIFGRDFIAVDSRLHGAEKLAVIFHELAHCLFHAPASGPVAGFHHVGGRTRKETEADLFALCAVMPRTVILNRSFDELISDGFPAEMVATRCEIHKRYKL